MSETQRHFFLNGLKTLLIMISISLLFVQCLRCIFVLLNFISRHLLNLLENTLLSVRKKL